MNRILNTSPSCAIPSTPQRYNDPLSSGFRSLSRNLFIFLRDANNTYFTIPLERVVYLAFLCSLGLQNFIFSEINITTVKYFAWVGLGLGLAGDKIE